MFGSGRQPTAMSWSFEARTFDLIIQNIIPIIFFHIFFLLESNNKAFCASGPTNIQT